MPSIYFVNPRSDFPTYFGAEVFRGRGFPDATLIADCAITTIAALAPPDFEVRVCEEYVEPVDFESDADFVGVTGKITQFGRMQAIAGEFRRRGRTVLMGGPFASLCPETVRPHCDVLVRGEVEGIAEQLFADLREGRWKDEYDGGKADLSASPIPRWDLYPLERAIMGTIQTSRGCPFECEFCDAIAYYGRKQRHKPVARVLAECDVLYERGLRTILLADDNFTVYRTRAKEVLEALRSWNLARDRGRVGFVTQLSIDAARDEELLDLCARAGLTRAFIGIETPNEESLGEVKKRQNMKIDLVEQLGRFHANGITVYGGMIVGFDGDGPDIFERQYEFAMASGVPIFSLGALVAPAATPLFDRMERDGRLLAQGSQVAAMPWNTNIVPRQMTREQLIEGLKGLSTRLYHPRAFLERMEHFLDGHCEVKAPVSAQEEVCCANGRAIDAEVAGLLSVLCSLGPDEERMVNRLFGRAMENPALLETITGLLFSYHQVRYMYEQGQLWNSQLPGSARVPRPAARGVQLDMPA